MVNCNPETVSTDYDTSDRLYFEPLTFEDVLNIVEKEQPLGVIVQFGGQTPLKLAVPLERAGVPILGTRPTPSTAPRTASASPTLLRKLGLAAGRRRPPRAPPTRPRRIADDHRLPGAGAALLRAGRARHGDRLRRGATSASTCGRRCTVSPEHPILIDKFLEDALEIDVDALCDGQRRGGRRRHGAHREGGHPLRRLGLRAAALLARRRPGRAAPGADAGARPRAGRGRASSTSSSRSRTTRSTCSR